MRRGVRQRARRRRALWLVRQRVRARGSVPGRRLRRALPDGCDSQCGGGPALRQHRLGSRSLRRLQSTVRRARSVRRRYLRRDVSRRHRAVRQRLPRRERRSGQLWRVRQRLRPGPGLHHRPVLVPRGPAGVRPEAASMRRSIPTTAAAARTIASPADVSTGSAPAARPSRCAARPASTPRTIASTAGAAATSATRTARSATAARAPAARLHHLRRRVRRHHRRSDPLRRVWQRVSGTVRRGVCVDNCDGFPDQCGNSAPNTNFDPLHCGECGHACEVDQVCVGGECRGYDPAPCDQCPCDCNGGPVLRSAAVRDRRLRARRGRRRVRGQRRRLIERRESEVQREPLCTRGERDLARAIAACDRPPATRCRSRARQRPTPPS